MNNRRKQECELRRVAILKAARHVFARQGYAQTVVDDIAAQAGIAKGTLYLYFPSKEEIYLAVLLEDTRRLNALTRERIATVEGWRGKLRAFFEVRREYLENELDFVRIFLGEIRNMMARGTKLNCAFYDAVRESEGIVSRLLAEAVGRGEIRAVDPELAAATAVDVIRGVMERRLLGWGGPADFDFALDFLERSLARR